MYRLDGYLGRVLGLGLTEDERLFGICAASGRSDPSKRRIGRIIDDGKSLFLDSHGPRTPEQEADADNIFYNSIMINDEYGTVVLSNGKQTKLTYDILNTSDLKVDYPTAIAGGLFQADGAETDRLGTPRITGILDAKNPDKAAMGIVTEEKGVISKFVHLVDNEMKYISTYKDENDRFPKGVIIPKLVIPGGEFEISGKTAQELADNVYDSMNQDLVVYAAAVLWNPDKDEWELAVRNLHE